MQKVGIFIAGTLGMAIAAFAGCSSSGGGTGANGTTTKSSSSSSGNASSGGHAGGTASSSSGGTGGSTSSSSGAGGAVNNPAICNPPTPAADAGSCVAFNMMETTELDAGLDDAGNASISICNPVTNVGCTGTDICDTDNSNKYWICYQGSTPSVGACGSCSSDPGLCKGGNTCINFTGPDGGAALLTECVKYCCTDTDCGGTAMSCNKTGLSPALPNGIGICSK